MLKCEDIQELISGYLDRELTSQKRQKVEVHMETCHSCRSTYESLQKQHQLVGQLPLEQMTDAERRGMLRDFPARGSRWVGVILLLVGILTLWLYGIYEGARDEPFIIQVAVGMTLVGFLVLFLSVLRDRLYARRTDRYKDVEL